MAKRPTVLARTAQLDRVQQRRSNDAAAYQLSEGAKAAYKRDGCVALGFGRELEVRIARSVNHLPDQRRRRFVHLTNVFSEEDLAALLPVRWGLPVSMNPHAPPAATQRMVFAAHLGTARDVAANLWAMAQCRAACCALVRMLGQHVLTPASLVPLQHGPMLD